MADKVAATYHPQAYACDRCGARYTSVIAMIWCCDESAYGDDD